MKTFNLFLCFFMLLTVSITSCTDKDIPSPSLPGSTTANDAASNREEDPIIIRGHVKNSNGSVIAGASANLFIPGQDTAIRTVTSNTDGQYTMSGLSSGDYYLKISAAGYVTKTVNILLTVNTERTDTLVTP